MQIQDGTILANMEQVFNMVAIAEGRQCRRCGCIQKSGWAAACTGPSCLISCAIQAKLEVHYLTLQPVTPVRPGFPLHLLDEMIGSRSEVIT